jgi:hypothetical protein
MSSTCMGRAPTLSVNGCSCAGWEMRPPGSKKERTSKMAGCLPMLLLGFGGLFLLGPFGLLAGILVGGFVGVIGGKA